MKCPVCGVNRDVFADETAWFAHVSIHPRAEFHRLPSSKRVRRERDRLAKKQTPAEREARKRERHRVDARRHRRRDPEGYRAYRRGWSAGWRERNRDTVRVKGRMYSRNYRARLKALDPLAYEVQLQNGRDWFAAHPEYSRDHWQTYYPEHREEILARRREKYAEKPGYLPRTAISQRTRVREGWIIGLREKGLTWKEIAERIGSTPGSCASSWTRAMKRRGDLELTLTRRSSQQNAKRHERDAFLLGSYRDGMTWATYASITGYRSPDTARAAYHRALERAKRPLRESA